jgi:primase-polymerase (primpol)-like protein
MDITSRIQLQQETVGALYQQLRDQQARAKTRSKPSRNGTGPSLDLDDDTIIQKALGARNGQKFAKLWAGDISSYPSHSEADLALCRELVYWTEDPQQIDCLFRLSGLMREKWDERPQYAAWTITKAIETPHDRYQGVSTESNGQPNDEDSHSSEKRVIQRKKTYASQLMPENSVSHMPQLFRGRLVGLRSAPIASRTFRPTDISRSFPIACPRTTYSPPRYTN